MGRAPKVALCVLTCSCNNSQPNALLRLLLPSVVRKTTPGVRRGMRAFVGVDFDDALIANFSTPWMRRVRGILPTTFVPVHPRVRRQHLPWNELMLAAYSSGFDYMIRTQDDVVVLTRGWVSEMIAALVAQRNFGAVGPTFCEGNVRAFSAMDVVHKTHMCIFKKHYYPEELENYHIDDWIWDVYRPHRARKLANVVVSHRVFYHGQQYRACANQGALVPELVARGKAAIEARRARCVDRHHHAKTRNDSRKG